jgi:hypothetical protein
MSDRKTLFSPDRVYRYQLWREFGADFLFDGGNKMKEGFVMFIGLNPSTADETVNDPTIRRCIGFSKRWGYGALCMTNLFAFRATQPKDMMAAQDPVGPFNDNHLDTVAREADLIVCAWGKDGKFKGRDMQVMAMLLHSERKMKVFGFNQDDSPKHPLYQPNDAKLERAIIRVPL